MRVLVVEDDDVYREALSRALRREGFDATAVDGVVAAEAAQSASFDGAVVDLLLRDGSGIDVVRALATSSPGCRTVLLSAHGTIPAAVEAMRAGAVDFLTKPASTAQVVAALQTPAPVAPPASAKLEDLERAHIERALAEAGGNVSLAARRLGVHRRTLQRKLQRLP